MQTFDHRDCERLNQEALFPGAILDDPWIVYHGTSGALEAMIDLHGIAPARSTVGDGAIRRVRDHFAQLGWDGAHPGGYPVLSSFSTFDVDRSRPVYLAESAVRAMTFASADFAGGEAARAFHYALRDLACLLTGDWPAGEPQPQWPSEPLTGETARRVREMLEEHSALRGAVEQLRRGHAHGLVYAVKLQPADVLQLEDHRSMGLMYDGVVPPDRLAAKARVPREFAQCGEDMRRVNFRLNSPLPKLIAAAREVRAMFPDVPRAALGAAIDKIVRERVGGL